MTKVNRAKEFLDQKDKVVFSVIFRGRENAHKEEGRKVMEGVISQLAEVGKVETPPLEQGRRLICMIAPK